MATQDIIKKRKHVEDVAADSPQGKKAKQQGEGIDMDEVSIIKVRPKVFPFLDLPPGLRNQIYKYVFKADGVWIAGTSYGRAQIFGAASVHLAALLRTCRQINREAASVLYGGPKFTFNMMSGARLWLKGIGQHEAAPSKCADHHAVDEDDRKCFLWA